MRVTEPAQHAVTHAKQDAGRRWNVCTSCKANKVQSAV